MDYKIDLFSIFIFLGIVQAIFLLLFFFSKKNRKTETNVYQGILVLAIASCAFEILLCYTGYIIDCLWLVDFSEPLAFTIGPAFYLMVVSLIHGRTTKLKYTHFIVPVVWLLLQIPFFIQSNDVKFNAWVSAYHPTGMAFRDAEIVCDYYLLNIPNHSELVLVHLSVYTLLGFIVMAKAFRSRKESFWETKQSTLLKLRASALQIVIVILLIFAVKLFNRDDMGDHFFAAYVTIAIYLISFQVIQQSGFFKQPSLLEQTKYKTSSLTEAQQKQLLEKLRECMATQKPFLKSDFSLPELADQLKTSVHFLSQVINNGLNKSFFEMTAQYRIEEAKRLLKEKPNIKVEEIAEEVGYNSKSSFNTAFKRIAGQTPSEWRSTL